MADKKLRVGVVGLGEIAQISHMPFLQELPYFEIGAICDLSPTVLEKIGEKYSVSERYTDYQKMVKQDDLDLSLIHI